MNSFRLTILSGFKQHLGGVLQDSPIHINEKINQPSGDLSKYRGDLAKLIAARVYAKTTNENDSNLIEKEKGKKATTLDNLMNIDPKRPTLSVEEMLKLKREEGLKNKNEL